MHCTITEASRDISVLEEMDVLVAGGGVSGFAAAIAAARTGARTILLERNGCLGGVATATLMANIGNRFLTHSGEQIVQGIAAELIERLVAVGAASPHWKHRDVPGCVIDSERMKVVMIEMLEEAGVTILTHAFAARPILREGGVAGCFIESKSGRQAVLAKNTVDATGELDLMVQTDAHVVSHLGNCSLLFKISGVDLDAFVEWLRKDPEGFPDGRDWVRDVETLARNYYDRGIFFFPHYGGKDWAFMKEAVAKGEFKARIPPAFNLDVLGMYALRGRGTVVINSNYYIFDKRLDIRELSRYETHAQKMCYYVADFLKAKVPGFEESRVEHLGVDLGLRGARYVVGRAILREAHFYSEKPVHFDDVVATGVAQRKPGDSAFFYDHTFDVPFGIMVPVTGPKNIIVGSAKSICTEGGHKRLIRGMSGCMMVGQAAGTAAAIGAASGIAAADVPIRDLQRRLLADGVRLGAEERLKELGLR